MPPYSSPILYKPVSPLAIDHAEVLRYLGYGNHKPDDATASLVADCAKRLTAVIQPRVVYSTFSLKILEDGVSLDGCELVLPGRDIVSHLQSCHQAVLFCATLSSQADRIIRSAQAADMASGLVMDSCATTAVEQLCDEAEYGIKQQFPGCYFTTRYSPGYGDLPLSIQKDFLALLDAPRKIGLCATDSSILTPRKSVTAILGVTDVTPVDSMTGCAHCNLRETCALRRKGEHCGLSNSVK